MHFYVHEDILIHFGYVAHKGRWDDIHRHFVPTKTSAQVNVACTFDHLMTKIHDRFRNMRAARNHNTDSPFQWIVQVGLLMHH